MSFLQPHPTCFLSDRSWDFSVPPEQLWPQLTELAEYRTWWPWLERFHPIGGFEAGARWSCTVSPPLPYDVSFSVLLEQVDPARSVTARVVGDIEGDAALELVRTDTGCTARLRSRLAPANPLLRRAGAAARPLVEWGHDWVLDHGQRQFADAAFAR